MELLACSLAELEKLLADALRLTREGDLVALAESPLAHAPMLDSWYVGAVPHGSDERGRAVQAMLEWLIERLRPNGPRNWTRLNWRGYNVLSAFYIEGRRIAEIAELMGVVEQTVYPIRTQALTALARITQEELARPVADRPNFAIEALYHDLPTTQQTILRIAAIDTSLEISLLYELAQSAGVGPIAADLQTLTALGVLQTNAERSEYALTAKLVPFIRTWLHPDEAHQWHLIVGKAALQRGEPLSAAWHFRLAGALSEAAQLLIERHQAIIDAFQAVELQHLLSEFKAAEVPPSLWIGLKLLLGDVAMTMNDVTTALREYQQALAAEDVHVKAEAYYKRGKAFRSQSTDEAEAHFRYSVGLLEQHPPTPLLHRVYLEQAWMYFQDRQDWLRAEESLRRAEALIDPADREAWAEWANAWGQYKSHQGHFEDAIVYHRDAWMAANEIQHALLMTHMAHNLGNDYMALGQYDLALVYLRQSTTLAQETGNHQMQGLCQKSLGACCFYLRQYRQAIEHYWRAHAIFAAMHNRNWQANTCYDLAEAYAELGEIDSMRRCYAEAIALANEGNLQRLLRDLEALSRTYAGLYPPSVFLNDRQQRAFDYLKQNPTITNRDYRDLTNVSPKQAARDLNELVEQRVLERVGEGRATEYRLAQ